MEVHQLAFGETTQQWVVKFNVGGAISQPAYLADLVTHGHRGAIDAVESFLRIIFADMRPVLEDIRPEADRARAVRISRWDLENRVIAMAIFKVNMGGEVIQVRESSEHIKDLAERTEDPDGYAAALQLAGREIASAISSPDKVIRIEDMLCGDRARTRIDELVARHGFVFGTGGSSAE